MLDLHSVAQVLPAMQREQETDQAKCGLEEVCGSMRSPMPKRLQIESLVRRSGAPHGKQLQVREHACASEDALGKEKAEV